LIGVKDIAEKLYPTLKLAFTGAFKGITAEFGSAGTKPNPLVLDNIKDRIIILSEKSQEKLHGDLRYQLLEGIQNNESITDLKKRIKTVFSGTDAEVERIARTETIRASKAGHEEGFIKSGVWGKEWLAAINNKRTCKLCRSLNGQQVPVGDNFINTIDGSEIAGNMAHPNCRCGIKAVINDPTEKDEKIPVINYRDLSTKILKYESELKIQSNGKKIIKDIEEYTSEDFQVLNEYMKSGDIIPDFYGEKLDESEIKEKINNIDTFLEGAPKMNGTVYRGMKFSKEGKEPIRQFNKFVNDVGSKKSFMFKQFTSTSTDKDVALDFSMDKENYGVLFKIKSKNGVYLNGLSLIPEEKEVLFNKETKFKILGIDRSNPQNVQITMEEI
jgi:SPP1 gp7 family putative phage head morphogenesis protein